MDEESVQQVDRFVPDTCKTFSGFYIKLPCALKHMILRALVICKTNRACDYILMGFVKGSSYSVLLAFFQSYIEHNLKKNKIVVPFFCQPINFYELIVKF
jgi:hypothetical protein